MQRLSDARRRKERWYVTCAATTMERPLAVLGCEVGGPLARDGTLSPQELAPLRSQASIGWCRRWSILLACSAARVEPPCALTTPPRVCDVVREYRFESFN